MAFCKHCGNKLEDGAKFCPKCGNPTNGEVDAPKSDDNDKNNEDAKNTKVGCISLIVIILIIGYIFNKCSGGEDSKATDDATAPKTEQVTEKAEAQQPTNEEVNVDTVATEETEAPIVEEKVNTEEQEKKLRMMKIADMAYQKGYEKRKSTRMLISSEEAAYQDYILRYNEVPNEGADPERWELFKKEYMRGFAQAAQDMLKDAY